VRIAWLVEMATDLEDYTFIKHVMAYTD